MESNKPLRTHPKMTKVLLGQIDSLDKAGRSVEDIAAALNTTPEAVQRGIDKLRFVQRLVVHLRWLLKRKRSAPYVPNRAARGVVMRRTTAFGRLA